MTQTVNKEQLDKVETYAFSAGLCGAKMEFTIVPIGVERSYEDRDVYFSAKGVPDCEEGKLSDIVSDEVGGSLRGEDAIALGTALIEAGRKALMDNMINHQRIHAQRRLEQFFKEGRISGITFEVIDENPANYGQGFRTFKITPYWDFGKAPQYEEDFSMETVIYWSPFDEEYAEQIKYWTRGLPYKFIGYDRFAEVIAFQKSVAEIERNTLNERDCAEEMPTCLE